MHFSIKFEQYCTVLMMFCEACVRLHEGRLVAEERLNIFGLQIRGGGAMCLARGSGSVQVRKRGRI